jgi:hypothetical protein
LAGDFNARTAELKDFSVFTENDFPNGGEYLLENYISFLTDSNLPQYEMNSGGISTTPIKTSSSNLNNVDDTFTQNTN